MTFSVSNVSVAVNAIIFTVGRIKLLKFPISMQRSIFPCFLQGAPLTARATRFYLYGDCNSIFLNLTLFNKLYGLIKTNCKDLVFKSSTVVRFTVLIPKLCEFSVLVYHDWKSTHYKESSAS